MAAAPAVIDTGTGATARLATPSWVSVRPVVPRAASPRGPTRPAPNRFPHSDPFGRPHEHGAFGNQHPSRLPRGTIRDRLFGLAGHDASRHETEQETAHVKVSKLSAPETALLDRFLASKGLAATASARAAHYQAWHKVMTAKVDGNLARIANAARVPSQPATTVASEGYDDHDARYRHQAWQALMQRHPASARLAMEQWTFDATSLAELLRMQQRLLVPMPGGTPHVLFALPDSGAVLDMQRAWAPSAQPAVIQHSDAARLMEGYRGQTLIIIGHMTGERGEVLTAATANGRPVSFSVADLSEQARRNKVLFFPIGCSSAGSSAVGFTHKIDDAQVGRFLSKLQSQRETVGDLLTAMNEIGIVQVNGAKVDRMLQVVVKSSKTAASETTDSGVAAAVVTMAEALELGAPGEAASAVDAMAQELDVLTEDERPWLDRGPLRWWRAVYREHPWRTLLGTSALTALGGWAAVRLGRHWNPPAVARRRPLMYRVALALFGTAVALLFVSALHAFFESDLWLALPYAAGLSWLAYQARSPVQRLLNHATAA